LENFFGSNLVDHDETQRCEFVASHADLSAFRWSDREASGSEYLWVCMEASEVVDHLEDSPIESLAEI
jgi:hypothetical protein